MTTTKLSIAIPAFDRPGELEFCLNRFISQIVGKYENDVEIVISDDCSPNDSLAPIRQLAGRYKFIKYRRYEKNIGLERNLIACSEGCTGEFLWLFGDDDFLETDNGLDEIIELLREGRHDVYVLNRTRRSFDLSKLISDNWMRLDPRKRFEFSGLREFCLAHGFISIIGFISVNILRRVRYQGVDAGRYFGTMYPQLGAMVEAFHDRPTLLVGKPLVCHRTQTAEEKRAALGAKQTEADFMADVRRRNAIYFSHPYVAMLDDLVEKGAFTPADIVRIPENTVINGLLIDFLIQTVTLNRELALESRPEVWERTARFFRALPLDAERRRRIEPVLPGRADPTTGARPALTASAPKQTLTISVITPSYNQGQFLGECLASVRDQTYQPIEHLVFDPGSKDDSRAIAGAFSHVTLIAEPDEGQSDAVNKGFRRARGDIIAWLNSDDCFAHPRVFERVVQRFLEPDAPDIVYGKGIYINESGQKLRDYYVNRDPATLHWRLQQEDGIMQPAVFMRRSVIEKLGPLRADLHFSMDYEYWIRCVKAGLRFAYVDEDFAFARYHASNKTWGMRGKSYAEVCDMMKKCFGYAHSAWLKRYAAFLAEGHDGVLVNSSTMSIRDETKLERIYRELLVAYNSDRQTYRHLSGHADQKGHGETLHEMNKLGISPRDPLPCPDSITRLLIGPYSRADAAHIDETRCIAEYLAEKRAGLMIDVGAHHGSALSHFLDRGWQVLAFEPDDTNRSKLEERLAKHPNAEQVILDTRAVSNETLKGVSFYASQVSTGISGLSVFHASHRKTQEVDTVTLREALAPRNIAAVDFLKIDTEGHDLFVLQGFPWERFKPAVIECEFEDAKTILLGYAFHDLAKFLVDKGYAVYVSEWHPVVRYGIRHDWNRLSRYPCELSDGKAWGNLIAFRESPNEGTLIATVRGNTTAAVNNISKISKRSRTLVILGNGPSLKGFDFTRFKDFDAIGMNAAYRYWDQIGWYPRYYICLDLVVGLSHKDQIARLIRERASNGIECFMLRRNLLEVLPRDLASLACVLDFDLLLEKLDLLSTPHITTGSHASLFGVLLGYNRMILMGVDNNYVEKVSGAEEKGGTVLEMAETPADNPNYFFGNYQAAGDRFNIPNPIPELHVKSWREVEPALTALGVKVWNGSSISRVDAFPKRDFSEIEEEEAALREAAGLGGDAENESVYGNWQVLVSRDPWNYCRWECSGERATLKIPINRNRATLAIIACGAMSSWTQQAGLAIEVDNATASHAVRDDLNPKCIVVSIPENSQPIPGVTTLTLVFPRIGRSGSSNPGGADWISQFVASSQVSIVPANPSLPIKFKNSFFSALSRRLGLSKPGPVPGDFPLPHFDGIAYLSKNLDVAKSVITGEMPSALEHYCRHGYKEGRRFILATMGRPNEGVITELFDGIAYLKAHADVANAVRSGGVASALDHYIKFGRKESREATPRFDGSVSKGSALDLMRLEVMRAFSAQLSDLRGEVARIRAELDGARNQAPGTGPDRGG